MTELTKRRTTAMKIATLEALAERLKDLRNVTILTHAHPDGDTIGAGFGLCYYLRSVGVKANVKNSDGFPQKFEFLFENYKPQEFEEECVVSVDVADVQLLGAELEHYADRIDLCIDHHVSNKMVARDIYVDGDASATCLIIFELLKVMGAKIDKLTASCLYTGIATDTGCFMFQNTTPAAHRAAADLKELGVDATFINRRMFQVKSSGRIFAEQKVISAMRFANDGQIALIAITNDLINKFNVDRADLDGFAGIPLSVDGVKIGITLKQQPEDESLFKVSIRTVDADASAIAERFGGGGHIRAAGCTVLGMVDEVAEKVISAAAEYL